MTIFQSIILGTLQGLTEFLPVSSSGHLEVVKYLFKLNEVPLLFSIFLHLATLLAVIIFFKKRLLELIIAFINLITRKNISKTSTSTSTENILTCNETASKNTVIAIIIATVITGILGILVEKSFDSISIKFIFVGFLITSILLIASSIFSKKRTLQKSEIGVSKKQAIIIGISQGLGTLPGISRSGATISGGLFSGLNREAAGEFSFIVSIPAIFAAFLLELKDLGNVSESVGILQIILGSTFAFAIGYLSLFFLMKLIKKGKLEYFAIYLIPLAILGLLFIK